jgi:hypothetical protein
VVNPSDLRYDFIWRHGGVDTLLVTFMHHFDPQPTGYNAVEYDADATGIAAAAAAGDQLVWRWSVVAGADAPNGMSIPNGNGTSSGGRYPSITLPPSPPSSSQ